MNFFFLNRFKQNNTFPSAGEASADYMKRYIYKHLTAYIICIEEIIFKYSNFINNIFIRPPLRISIYVHNKI